MIPAIKKDSKYAEAGVTVVGFTRGYTGRPQYFLVNSDQGENKGLKFPGVSFRAPLSENQTLEDAAMSRFEEQTGFKVSKSLGLRAIIQTRSRHSQWMFRNLFFAYVHDSQPYKKNDGRDVYLANLGDGEDQQELPVYPITDLGKKVTLPWVIKDNMMLAGQANEFIDHFNWDTLKSNWLRKIPCLGATPQTDSKEREPGCAIAVASIFLLYKPSPSTHKQVIELHRVGDEYPGYGGGKIETPEVNKKNLTPVSCCAQEGSEEYGFQIEPRALIGCAVTSLEVPINEKENHYNSIITYSFVAEPTNPLDVEAALEDPELFLERKPDGTPKFSGYVVEDLKQHRERLQSRRLRTPDMINIGRQFFLTTPGEKIPLNQIFSSGLK